MFHKEVVIDGKGHLVGRLASYVAKLLVSGQRVAVVRCEQLMMSGSLFRNRVKFMEYLGKYFHTNPRRGFHHFRAPSMMFHKAVRGMVPRKMAKGECALDRLKVFDGIPSPYDVKKRKVVPDALKIVRLKPFRPFCKVGELAASVGWKRAAILSKFEEKRQKKAHKYHELKVKKDSLLKKAKESEGLKAINDSLAKLGY
jgi:large subunit ribosomal protein L13Ae